MSENYRKKLWNDRHRNKANTPLAPHHFLVDSLSLLKSGTALDLACGSGSNALFLARNGFKVTAVDFSEVALNRLTESARSEQLVVQSVNLDVDDSNFYSTLGRFDNFIIIHFKLKTELLEFIPTLLNSKGIFLYCTFNKTHSLVKAFPEKYCLQPEELLNKTWTMDLLSYTSFQDTSGYYDAYIFRNG